MYEAVEKLPESKNLTVLYHLITANYYLVKKKKNLIGSRNS